MTMIQAHKRTKAYTHTFPDVTLKFKPNELGHVVCDVQDQGTVDRLLATPTGFRLYGEDALAPSAVLLQAEESPYVLKNGEDVFDLRPLDDDALHNFCTVNSIKVHHKAKGNTIRDAIVAHLKKPE